MSLTPLDIQKTQFSERRKGARPGRGAGLPRPGLRRARQPDRPHRSPSRAGEPLLRRPAAEAEEREHQLQETLVRGQKLSEEIVAASHKEAQLLIKEAELAADKIVEQALEQAQRIEARSRSCGCSARSCGCACATRSISIGRWSRPTKRTICTPPRSTPCRAFAGRPERRAVRVGARRRSALRARSRRRPQRRPSSRIISR